MNYIFWGSIYVGLFCIRTLRYYQTGKCSLVYNVDVFTVYKHRDCAKRLSGFINNDLISLTMYNSSSAFSHYGMFPFSHDIAKAIDMGSRHVTVPPHCNLHFCRL